MELFRVHGLDQILNINAVDPALGLCDELLLRNGSVVFPASVKHGVLARDQFALRLVEKLELSVHFIFLHQ